MAYHAGAELSNIDFCYYNRKNQVIPQEVQPKFMISELLKLLQFVN